MNSAPIYISIENKIREFIPRLESVAHLLNAGHTVVVGQQWGLFENVRRLPPGVFLFKKVNKMHSTIMAIAKASNHVVVAMDEDALMCSDDACFAAGMDPASAGHIDLFLAQSDKHRDAINKTIPSLTTAIAGNPQAERLTALGAYQRQIKEIENNCAPYILFVTNFKNLNSSWGSKIRSINDQVRTERAWDEGVLVWEKENIAMMRDVMDWCIENLDKTVAIRPHPAEDISFWVDLYGDRAAIIRGADPVPWMAAADLVIHSGCVTGLEAVLLDKPVLNLEPSPHPFLQTILKEINATVDNAQSARTVISQFLKFGSGPIAGFDPQPALEAYFCEPGGAENIALALGAFVKKTETYDFSAYKKHRRQPHYANKCTITMQEMLKALRSAMKIVGKKTAVDIAELDDSLFIIKRK